MQSQTGGAYGHDSVSSPLDHPTPPTPAIALPNPHIFPTLKGLQPHPSAAHSHRHTAIAGQDSRAYGLLHQSAIDDREGKDRCNPFQG